MGAGARESDEVSEERNEDGLTYKEWLSQVDDELAKRGFPIQASELPDHPSLDRSWWEEGSPASDAASDILYDNGYIGPAGDKDDGE